MKYTLEKDIFKKPLVFAIFHRLGFNSLYIYMAYSVANVYLTIG